MPSKFFQGNIMNNARKWYKDHLNVPFLNKIIKSFLRFGVSILAKLKGMEFSRKYDWDWKLEMLLEKYEKETVILAKKFVKPSMTVIDIGAHIGYYTKLFSKLTGKNGFVYAFEPEEENFRLLEKNTKNLTNVKLVKKALSDRNGFIDFYRAENHTAQHSVLKSGIRHKKITIPAITLDSFMKRENIKKIDFIKIDIEGGEPYAFAGAKDALNRKPLAVIMEFAPENFKISKISPSGFLQNLNKEFGFSFYKILDDGNLKLIATDDLNEKITEGKELVNLFLKKW
jgi:FkbM family methyltransferase